MKRNKRNKMIMIVGLVVAVVGMSIGFAAFSSVLTISSRATVTPNTNFKMKLYGVLNPSADRSDFELSETKAVCEALGASCSEAIIDNENFTISNLSFDITDIDTGGVYYFEISNVGDIAGYVNLEPFRIEELAFIKTKFGLLSQNCIPHEGTSQALVNSACENIGMFVAVQKVVDGIEEAIEDSELENGFYKIEPGQGISLVFLFMYSNSAILADGPFTVEIEDAVFDITSSPPKS